MTIQKQLVHLNLTGGLQKKDDQFIVIPSKLAVADNVEFDDASTVVRRGGQAAVSLGGFASSTIKRAFVHQGVATLEVSGTVPGLIRAGAGGVAQVLNPQTVNGFTPPRAAPRAGMVTQRIAGITPKGTAPGAGIPFFDGSFDCASIGNVTCYAFETRSVPLGTQTIRVVMIDDANNLRIYDNTVADGTRVLTKPRVVANGSRFFIFFGSFVSGTGVFDIKSFTLKPAGIASGINTVAAAVAGLGGTVEGTASDAIIYDAAISNDFSRLGMVLRSTAILTQFLDISQTDGFTLLRADSGVPSATIRSLSAIYTKGPTDYRLHGFYGVNTNVALAMHYNYTANTTSGESVVGTAAGGTTVGRLTAYEQTNALIYLAFDSLTTTGTVSTSVLRLSSFNHTYGGLSECASMSPWFVGGRIATCDGRLYLPMVFVSTEFQGTTFVIDLTSALTNLGTAGALGAPPHVLARIDYGEGALTYDRWKITTRVPDMPLRGGTLILPYLKFETDLRLAGTNNETAFALARATIDLASQVQDTEVNGVTFLAGACPYIFDGSNYVEEGFHHGPEIVGNLVAVAAGGAYTLGSSSVNVKVVFTWAWQDSQGNWHESAPSGQKEVNITAALPCITPTIVSPPTQKPGARLLMYRTKGSSTDTSLYLAVTAGGASISSDTDLDDGEQLYTAGNVLPNTPAPACRHVSLFQKRLALSGCGDGSRVYVSKRIDTGYGVEFTSGDPTHQVSIPADKGRAVASEEMDDRLVVLCENGVGIIDGQGPNASGTQGQYSDFRSIINETGASWGSPKSIIRGPEGVWFRSPFGIRLVSRSGGLGTASDGKQAGSEVDSLVSGNVVAVAGGAKQQIRFYQSSGTCLVWDYQWKQWTRFMGMASVDAVFADGRYYHLSDTLLRYTDDASDFDVADNGATPSEFEGYIETAPLSFAGIQGFQRITRLMLLGQTVGASSGVQVIRFYAGFDFDQTSRPTGETASVGTTPVGGTIQVQHHFARQKCESLKIGIAFGVQAGNSGRFRLTDLTLQVGVKAGYNKLPSSGRF